MNRLSARLVPLLALLLALAACGPQQFAPTPTAIPLQATATAAPLPTRVPDETPATAAPNPTPSPVPQNGQPPAEVGQDAQVGELLAQRTARAFLDRLSEGDAEAISRLYLTAGAREGDAGRLVEQLAGDSAGLQEIRLLELRAASPTRYEIQALLVWAGDDQPLTAELVYEGGLWLVDGIVLGERQVQGQQAAAPPGAAPTAAAVPGSAPGPRPARQPALTGRFVFQVSSGGDIYVVNADGSGLRRVTDGLDPAWSPDGTTIAFARWRTPWGIYTISPDGTGEERVMDGNRFKEVAWSPEGDRIAFTISPVPGESFHFCFYGYCVTISAEASADLWMADLRTGEFLNLPLDDKVVHSPAWSPGGGRIAYAGDDGLGWIDLDGMATGRFASSSPWDNSPAFSPDGQHIAFMGRIHDRWEIFMMNADGSGRRQLTHGEAGEGEPTNSVAPTWSPDGSRIAFLSDRQGPWRIYVMGKDSSQPVSPFGQELDGLGLTYEWASERVVSWTR